ncbi:oligogalacturonate lyase family protein [Halomontanus rarus]|uniref:oligogalacturonate lyase family protein n=1 Tax=Halomontanus rarus TaxID=3034020 RepID=UPI0023E7B96C|nr:oligogalacturonate lyase family protein [Halovivax sp. TS33]
MSDVPSQGPKAGRNWPTERETYDDPNTGARVTRLTSYPGVPDWHLYFTKSGWYDDGRRLLFRSNRDGSRQLYSLDLESGLITQVTDLEGFEGDTTIHHETADAYFWVDDRLVRFDLDAFCVRDVVYEVPEGYDRGTFDLAADGSRFYVSIAEPVDLPGERSTFLEMMEAAPPTRILSIPGPRAADGAAGSTEEPDPEPELLHEESGWLSTHMDASPTRPNLFMYPQQGPWDAFEDKVWVQDADSGERWSVRPTPGDGGMGHQHWLADGERVGYHGWEGGRDDPDCFYGHVRFDGTDRVETATPVRETHCHTNTPSQFVCDGSSEVPWNLLYRWDDDRGEYEGPRKLATHDWGEDSPHPHSRLGPDGETVLFDSNRYDGESNLYLVEIPEFESLPAYEPN